MPPHPLSRFDLPSAIPDVTPVSKPVATRHALRNVRAFRGALLRWFDKNGADHPWRQTTDPYAILVSEVMLQQTTVRAVIQNRRFERFLKEFPNLHTLARAPENKLLRAWEGLGYYNRVRNLQKAARVILEKYDGEFPSEPRSLESLPGIGRYTAGAIASFAFGYPSPIVEANITRLLSRLFDWRKPAATPESQSQLWSWAETLLPSRDARSFNSALMELGQSHCSPRSPSCPQCPVRDFCATRNPENLPLKQPRRQWIEVDEHVVLVRKHDGPVLMAREEGTRRKGLWKLPERDQDQLVDFPLLATRRYGITNHKVTLYIYHCTPSQLPPASKNAREKFHSSRNLRTLPMPSPFRRALADLL